MKKLISFLVALLYSVNLVAQEASNSSVEMADSFRADGKIYVVVAVVLIILAGMFIYLIRLDGKVSKIEKEVENQ